MQFHSHANQSHFHKNGFALRLALKQRHKGTRKWPIEFPRGHVSKRVDTAENILSQAILDRLLKFKVP